MNEKKENILVIKHGALGDIAIATAGFAAIRAHHPDAHIVCLTTKGYAELLSASPYFNDVWIDRKPKPLQRKAVRNLYETLNSKRWNWVYDLQTSARSTLYQWLFKRPWPKISNVSRWSTYPYTEKERHKRHALDNIHRQLKVAGIDNPRMPDMAWLKADVSQLLSLINGTETPAKPGEEGAAVQKYALLIPGGAAHRPEKRWPAENYAALAQELVAKKITPVLIGTQAEMEAMKNITTRVPQVVNLCGKTNFAELATLARGASFAIGNDTGPMHVIVAAGCPSVVLFGPASNPDYSAPVGKVKVLRASSLDALSVDSVLVVAMKLLA